MCGPAIIAMRYVKAGGSLGERVSDLNSCLDDLRVPDFVPNQVERK